MVQPVSSIGVGEAPPTYYFGDSRVFEPCSAYQEAPKSPLRKVASKAKKVANDPISALRNISERPKSDAKFAAKTASRSTGLFKNVMKTFGKISGKTASSMKMISVITLPFTVVEFYENSKGVVQEKNKIDKAESGLDAAAEAGAILDGAVGITVAAMALHALRTGASFTTPLWAEVLGVVGFGFQIFAVASATSGIVRTFRCIHGMDEHLKGTGTDEERTKKTMEFLLEEQAKNPKYLKKKFHLIDGGSFANKMRSWVEELNDPTSENREEVVGEAYKMMRQLRWRAYGMVALKFIKISAVALSAIALVMVMFTPYGYIGYGIFALTTAVVLVSATADFVMLKKGRYKEKKRPKKLELPPFVPGILRKGSERAEDEKKRVTFEDPPPPFEEALKHEILRQTDAIPA